MKTIDDYYRGGGRAVRQCHTSRGKDAFSIVAAECLQQLYFHLQLHLSISAYPLCRYHTTDELHYSTPLAAINMYARGHIHAPFANSHRQIFGTCLFQPLAVQNTRCRPVRTLDE